MRSCAVIGIALLVAVAGGCRQAEQRPLAPLPGAAPLDPALAHRLGQASRRRAAEAKPRTRHLAPDGAPLYTNRLILEDSPYLLQHAHNPVDWYPWGEEAFERARREHRPILLSVGYSTCHWCHVMAGTGGWPMTVWLTPDREPLYGGTYFPARDGDRGVRFGFLTLLRRVYE